MLLTRENELLSAIEPCSSRDDPGSLFVLAKAIGFDAGTVWPQLFRKDEGRGLDCHMLFKRNVLYISPI